jgi:hypothetical protein
MPLYSPSDQLEICIRCLAPHPHFRVRAFEWCQSDVCVYRKENMATVKTEAATACEQLDITTQFQLLPRQFLTGPTCIPVWQLLLALPDVGWQLYRIQNGGQPIDTGRGKNYWTQWAGDTIPAAASSLVQNILVAIEILSVSCYKLKLHQPTEQVWLFHAGALGFPCLWVLERITFRRRMPKDTELDFSGIGHGLI